MADVITYTADISLLIAEVELKYPEFIKNGRFVGINKTPIQKSGPASLALIRGPAIELYSLDNLQVLGTYDEVFLDAGLKSIYDSVYDRNFTYIDKFGTTQLGLKPEKFGVLA